MCHIWVISISDSAVAPCAVQKKAESPEVVAARQQAAAAAAAAERALVVHEKNEWNIEVVPKADIEPVAPSAAGGGGNPAQMNAIALPEGLSFSHVRKDMRCWMLASRRVGCACPAVVS